MKLLTILLLTAAVMADEVEQPQPKVPQTLSEAFQEIQFKMEGYWLELRMDRHDNSIQIVGKEIDDDLDKLIKSAEEEEKKRSDKPPKEKPRPAPEGPAGEARESKNSTSDLPPAERSEILQIYRKEFPVLWRARIEAYFVSILADEAKREAIPKAKK